MRSTLFAALLVATIPTFAAAQGGSWEVSLGGGATIPLGTSADLYQTGYHGGAAFGYRPTGSKLVYKLNANLTLPSQPVAGAMVASRTLNPPLLTGTNEQVIDGQGIYARTCAGCHGAGAQADKSIPDLRYSPTLGSLAEWKSIVVDGARASKGMASFKSRLAEGDAAAIFHYVISQANKDKATEQAAAKR